MIPDILKKSIVILIGLLLLSAIIMILYRSKNANKTERTQIFKTADYFNAWILLLCFVVTLVFGAINHFDMKNSVHATIALNYSEASLAQNSNGTRFNMAEIISDEVIERAIEKGALENVTVKQLKDCLTVAPYVQGGVSDETKYHISTEFIVTYQASKHTDHLDSENVINLISTAYKEYYIEKYTDSFKLDDEKPDFETMEYMDIVAYLEKESSAVLNYLYGMAEKDSSFVTSSGNTFNSLAGKVYQFRETQINENLRSLILQNGIVRNKDGYVGRLSYRNKNVDFTRMKNSASFVLCNQAIAMYSEEMTRIVLVPTWDKEGKYYMGRTKVGLDELSVMATKFSDYVASYEKEIMDNNLAIEKIVAGNAQEQSFESADALIESIYKTIKSLGKEAISTGREYSNYKMNQCIAVSVNGTTLIKELKFMVAFACLAYAAFTLFRIAKRFPKKV